MARWLNANDPISQARRMATAWGWSVVPNASVRASEFTDVNGSNHAIT